MTLSQSDVLELLDTLRAGGDLDIVRKSVELVLQALIDAGTRLRRTTRAFVERV